MEPVTRREGGGKEGRKRRKGGEKLRKVESCKDREER